MKKILLIIALLFITGCNQVTAWPDGNIYYKWDDNFTDSEKKIIVRTMNEWEQSTGKVTFIETESNNKNPLKIKITSSDSSATIGYNSSDSNELKINIKNITISECLHECGHIVGLSHEHQRWDRENYIHVNYDNIDKDGYFDYRIEGSMLYDVSKLPYDYESIMHYGQTCFSNGNGITFSVFDEQYDGHVGYFDSISILDIARVSLIYR
jgi:hypothetical protein